MTRTRAWMLVTALAVVALGTTAARADWWPGEPVKMENPQLPDPMGWDVRFTEPKVLADDWRCSETGPVDDIHIWFSDRLDRPEDLFMQLIVNVAIYDNITEDPANNEPSKPGQLLWGPFIFEPRVIWWGNGDQGWYDPNLPIEPDVNPVLNDHQNIYQMNIEEIGEDGAVEPFRQEEGEIYWLAATVIDLTNPGEAVLGWKTSQDHFMDDAVFIDDWFPEFAPEFWTEMYDPETGESLDLAFVITPEPATLALMGLGVAGLVASRRRRRG